MIDLRLWVYFIIGGLIGYSLTTKYWIWIIPSALIILSLLNWTLFYQSPGPS